MGKRRQDWDREEKVMLDRLDFCRRTAPSKESLGAEVWAKLQDYEGMGREIRKGLGDLSRVNLAKKE